MASSLCRRAIFQVSRRPFYMSACQGDGGFADPLDHATGLEKAELLAHLAGNDDPFDTKVMKRGPGTKDKPNLVGSYFKSRLVGCVCEEDQMHINWMWLHKGQPRRCECGHWFKLVERAPFPAE
ncbi:cytochrome c oxidase subunit 5B, mitochondrial isoform X2 [Copidosoma floridanum]|uniref:cytochrome c oxidase subunit 5B, mitochondrial isoform X2 n=1 Tax=Copidosoma floridanum TaxID=29053 RepID=UPI000C6F6BF7|nr:cytochrome c oxidase subunit 5B, mitochondrial isoform X2 [Copidosoma floridanum]